MKLKKEKNNFVNFYNLKKLRFAKKYQKKKNNNNNLLNYKINAFKLKMILYKRMITLI